MRTARTPKIVEMPALLALRETCRQAGRTVVWTNGCFDLLHAGHVRTGSLNGSEVATYSTSSLALGTHVITASYGGDTDFSSSTSSSVSQVSY
jgi:bifunctional ADP-heptose synthase (sugar kinase/adenylyltransferase)